LAFYYCRRHIPVYAVGCIFLFLLAADCPFVFLHLPPEAFQTPKECTFSAGGFPPHDTALKGSPEFVRNDLTECPIAPYSFLFFNHVRGFIPFRIFKMCHEGFPQFSGFPMTLFSPSIEFPPARACVSGVHFLSSLKSYLSSPFFLTAAVALFPSPRKDRHSLSLCRRVKTFKLSFFLVVLMDSSDYRLSFLSQSITRAFSLFCQRRRGRALPPLPKCPHFPLLFLLNVPCLGENSDRC